MTTQKKLEEERKKENRGETNELVQAKETRDGTEPTVTQTQFENGRKAKPKKARKGGGKKR